jgi:hypothetical protein
MNINKSCNAYWSSGTINHYRSGNGCRNTGELAGVFVHEWGHGMDANDLVSGVSYPGEGIADIYAAASTQTKFVVATAIRVKLAPVLGTLITFSAQVEIHTLTLGPTQNAAAAYTVWVLPMPRPFGRCGRGSCQNITAMTILLL